jgi:opacity protein-like surface antigen
MKKFLLLVVCLAAMTTSVQAQGIKFGVKGGLNITKMSFSKDVVKSDNKTGFFVGPTLKISLPAGFGVDIAALYDERSADVTGGYKEEESKVIVNTDGETIKQKSIQVAVNLRYSIGLSSLAGLYLALGPQFGFPVADKVFDTDFGEYRLKDANLSINFGAGVYMLGHLEIGVTYNLAAGKSGEFKNWNDVDTHNHAWQISAAYYF